MKKGVGMKIKENLSWAKKKKIREIVSDPRIVICLADKARAIVLENCESYLLKMQQQLDKGD